MENIYDLARKLTKITRNPRILDPAEDGPEIAVLRRYSDSYYGTLIAVAQTIKRFEDEHIYKVEDAFYRQVYHR
jgi:hypothetical protein